MSSDQYDAAFTAAIEAARQDGLVPVFQDRRAGLIETESRVAGSVLEPWRGDNASVAQTLENTLSVQRRRARFEFSVADFQAPPRADQAAGADVLGLDAPAVDLTQATGPLELRVWVYQEKGHTAGLRRSTWTRRKTTRTSLVVPERSEGVPEGQFWTPVRRDEAYERRLLSRVDMMMASDAPSEPQTH